MNPLLALQSLRVTRCATAWPRRHGFPCGIMLCRRLQHSFWKVVASEHLNILSDYRVLVREGAGRWPPVQPSGLGFESLQGLSFIVVKQIYRCLFLLSQFLCPVQLKKKKGGRGRKTVAACWEQ